MATDLPALARVRETWGDWSTFAANATQTWASQVEVRWAELRERAVQFVQDLRAAQQAIFAVPAKIAEYRALGGDPAVASTLEGNHLKLVERWTILVAGLHQDAKPDAGKAVRAAELGAAPLLIVAGVVISIVGIAFGLAAYQYASSLRTEADAQLREIDGRIEAMRRGKALQESTYKPPAEPSGTPWGLIITATALAAGAIWYTSRGKVT